MNARLPAHGTHRQMARKFGACGWCCDSFFGVAWTCTVKLMWRLRKWDEMVLLEGAGACCYWWARATSC